MTAATTKMDEPSGGQGELRRPAGRERLTALALFAGLLVVYHLNGAFLVGNDAVPNVHLALGVLSGRGLSFTPEDEPVMFTWSLATDDGPSVVKFDRWESRPCDPSTVCFSPGHSLAGHRATWRELRDAGRLRLHQPDYYLVPSVDPPRRGYVNQYGLGAGLTALPVFALESLLFDDLASRKAALWHGAKLAAALCVAASAALVYLTLLRLAGSGEALVIAATYGVATCVWSVASQTLWQSGPDVLLLALAAWCLVRLKESDWWAAGCGLAAGWAVVCRPTSALVVVTIGVYLAAVAWRRSKGTDASRQGGGPAPGQLDAEPVPVLAALRPLAIYVLAGLPLAIALGYYNWYYLGSPLRFGQTEAGRRIAAMQLGSGDLWQSSWPEGIAGLLISPSRGLLVYSPVFLFALWGAVRVWREPRFAALRPLSAAALLLLVVQAKWFDWHGGHSFGYRLLVDAAPLLALCSIAVAGEIRRNARLLALFLLLAAWSVGVQALGAWAYDVIGWNAREAYAVKSSQPGRYRLSFDRAEAERMALQARAPLQVVRLDVDARANRRRLWSVVDSPLVYYAAYFAESREQKRRLTEGWLETHVLRASRGKP